VRFIILNKYRVLYNLSEDLKSSESASPVQRENMSFCGGD
jgi:hypothetical protein